MTAKEKCLLKWQNKLVLLEKMVSHPLYGKYCIKESAKIEVIKEIIKDLNRFLNK